MTPRPDHAHVERHFRSLLAGAGLPAPDEVAHWPDAVAFYWHDTKAVVVIDLDEVDLDDFTEWELDGFAQAG
jgi:hypothetical protein